MTGQVPVILSLANRAAHTAANCFPTREPRQSQASPSWTTRWKGFIGTATWGKKVRQNPSNPNMSATVSLFLAGDRLHLSYNRLWSDLRLTDQTTPTNLTEYPGPCTWASLMAHPQLARDSQRRLCAPACVLRPLALQEDQRSTLCHQHHGTRVHEEVCSRTLSPGLPTLTALDYSVLWSAVIPHGHWGFLLAPLGSPKEGRCRRAHRRQLFACPV